MSRAGASGSEPGLAIGNGTPRRAARLGLVMAALAVAVGAWALFRFDPNGQGFFPVCLFHQLTGLSCPGCGSLRALHQLLHGNIFNALRLNALLVLAIPVLTWFGARRGWRAAHGRPAAWRVPGSWVWLVVFVVVGFSVWRNLPGHGWPRLG